MASNVRARGGAIGLPIAYALGGLLALALYGLAILQAPKFLVDQDLLGRSTAEQRLSAEHNARLIMISIGGPLFVAGGLFYTARNYRLAHRGQVTERFTKALERLGADQLYVRIGGVRALEHVMRDSAEHHADVVEVLVAFVRDRVPHLVTRPLHEGRWMLWPREPNSELPAEPLPDVQAALTALGRRPRRSKHERDALDLRQLHLQGARLDGARLHRADLRGTDLTNADLVKADLKHADLWSAILREADLNGANLRHARLGETNLQAAHLASVNLKGAYLGGANLHEADLFQATVTAAQLRQAVLSEHTNLPEGIVRDSSGEIWEKNRRSKASDALPGQH